MAYELLNAILNAQNSIPTPDLLGDYNRGKQLALSNQDIDEKSRVLGSRDSTEQMLANGDFQGALQNAQKYGDTESANNILNRINQNNGLKASVAQRLLTVPQEQRAAVLQRMAPTLSQQGVDPSGIATDDDSLGAIANTPVSSLDQQKMGVATLGAQNDQINATANYNRSQADLAKEKLEERWRPQEAQAKTVEAQARADDVKNKTGALQLDVWNKTHPILSDNQSTNVQYDENGKPVDLPNITMAGQSNTSSTPTTPTKSTSPYTQGYGNRYVPLPSMTLLEAEQAGNQQIEDTKGQIGQGNLGTSAMGSGQVINATRRAAIKQAFGLNDKQADNVLQQPQVQDRIVTTLVDNAMRSNNRAKQLKGTFTSLTNIPDNIINSLDRNTLIKLARSGENIDPISDDDIAAADNLKTAPMRTSPNSVVRQPQDNDTVNPTNPQDTSNVPSTSVPSQPSTPPQSTSSNVPAQQSAPVDKTLPAALRPDTRQQSINGSPILYDNDMKQDYALNGGGRAFIPAGTDANGRPLYNMTNVKEKTLSGDQLKAQQMHNTTNAALSNIQNLIRNGFNPATYVNYVANPAAFVGNKQAEQYRSFKASMDVIKSNMLHAQTGAAATDAETKAVADSIEPTPNDTPLNMLVKLNNIKVFNDGLADTARGRLHLNDVAQSTKDFNTADGYGKSVNEILDAYKSKDPAKLDHVNTVYGTGITNDVIHDYMNKRYLPDDDYDRAITARKGNDVKTMSELSTKYPELGLALRNNNLRPSK